jgi:hypothetical protein
MTVAPAAEGVTDPSDMPSAPVPDDPRFVAAATTSNAPTPDSSTAHPERNGALALKVAVTVAAPPVVTVAFQILSAWPAVASLIGEFVSCVYVYVRRERRQRFSPGACVACSTSGRWRSASSGLKRCGRERTSGSSAWIT